MGLRLSRLDRLQLCISGRGGLGIQVGVALKLVATLSEASQSTFTFCAGSNVGRVAEIGLLNPFFGSCCKLLLETSSWKRRADATSHGLHMLTLMRSKTSPTQFMQDDLLSRVRDWLSCLLPQSHSSLPSLPPLDGQLDSCSGRLGLPTLRICLRTNYRRSHQRKT